jgi:hypothetical protein
LFSKPQFESYRALGQTVIDEMVGVAGPARDLNDFVERVKEYIMRVSEQERAPGASAMSAETA